ncbi:hypothetical protein [Endozoicomonas sp. ALB091]|uniref:hypothetical protein n=1 Tax=Endozoicomonas sp. ALB091 TaxID=3403073 RepID=UPI003BB74C7E
MKLTDKVPYITEDGDVLEADRAVDLNRSLTDLRILGLITDDEFSAIAQRLHEQYSKALTLVPKEPGRG